MSKTSPVRHASPRLAASVTWMFAESPFLDRPSAAARAGFAAVECHYPYQTSPDDLRTALADAQIPILSINTAVQRLGPQDTGMAAIPGHETEAEHRFDEALEYLLLAGGRAIHVKPGNADAADPAAHACFVSHLRRSAAKAARHSVTLLIEPLNRQENGAYFLRSNAQAAAIIDEVGAPNLRLMFDLYHMRMDGGNVIADFARYRGKIGHLQFAGIPGRHEPDGCGDTGACLSMLAQLHHAGYDGWMAAEYRPCGPTADGLGWMKRLEKLVAER